MSANRLSFGRFRFDATQHLLFASGEAIALGHRAQRILALLLLRRGEIVTKGDLIEAVWGDQAVEDSNLSVQIAQLRRIIGAEWIRTVERVGYQFIADTAQAMDRPVLAVIPLTAGGGCWGIAAAIGDDLTTALGQFGAVRLLVHRPTGAGDANYLLEGSVRGGDGGTAVTMRLIEQRHGAYCWAERFLLEAGSSSAMDRLGGRIAASVVTEIDRAEGLRVAAGTAEASDAPTLYHRARAYLRTSSPDGYRAATHLLEQALALDEDNPRYLAAICEALHHQISMGWPAQTNNDDAERCIGYAMRGLALADADADALALFGTAIFRAGDHDLGHAVMQRAALKNPSSLTALVYAGSSGMHWGNLDEAERQFRSALQLAPSDPGQGFVMGGLARISMIRGAFDEALGWATKALAANPNYGGSHWTMVSASAHLGRDAEAHRRLDLFRRLHPGVTVASIKAGQPTRGRMAATLEGLERAGLSAA